jgi:hypothetical protein
MLIGRHHKAERIHVVHLPRSRRAQHNYTECGQRDSTERNKRLRPRTIVFWASPAARELFLTLATRC